MPRLSAPPRPARRPARRWLMLLPSRRAVIGAGLAAALGAAGVGGYEAWRRGLPALADGALATAGSALAAAAAALGFAVGEILVEGRIETPTADVVAALDTGRGAPILRFDAREARLLLEGLPWVRRAEVERRLPGTIFVRLTERTPLALWQREARRVVLLDTTGAEIPGVDLDRFRHLPLLSGDDAPAHAAALIALLATEPALARRVAAAVRVGGRRWTLRLDDGIEVLLPELRPEAAWARLADAERASRVLAAGVAGVDLRLPDRMILRVVRDEPPAPPPPAVAPRGRAARPLQRPT